MVYRDLRIECHGEYIVSPTSQALAKLILSMRWEDIEFMAANLECARRKTTKKSSKSVGAHHIIRWAHCEVAGLSHAVLGPKTKSTPPTKS